MARILHQGLFSWQELNELGDLERLQLVIEHLPDEELMEHLEGERSNGRDDYPVRAVWNSLLAGVVYEHESVASLRRELLRNGQLRQLCGFDVAKGERAVPPQWVYTRFMGKLMGHQELIDAVFDRLVDSLSELLPGFGCHLAIDSKPIWSHGRRRGNGERDGRRELDADWGTKTYRGKRAGGTLWEQVTRWFGYKLHLVVDGRYELPVGYRVTRASRNDTTQLVGMLEDLECRHGWFVERAETLAGDKAYDSWENNALLWDRYRIKPLLDIREMWKDGEQTRALYPDRVDNIVYDACGRLFCYCPETGDRRELAHCGFEKDRGCLKYRCPAAAYGLECLGRAECGGSNYGSYGRIVRVPLASDRRLFTPLARSSYAWKRLYRGRTAVERVNSRLDVSFGFEHHFIRGLAKMRFRSSLALIVMLGMALGRVRQKQEKYIRSLVWSPAAA